MNRVRESVWLTAVAEITAGARTVRTALVTFQPGDQNLYDQTMARARRAGWTRITRDQHQRGAWPPVKSGYVDVIDRTLIRFTAGPVSFYTGKLTEVADAWMTAARERPVAVAIVPVGTFDDAPEGPTNPARLHTLDDLALNGRLFIGLTPARFGELPTR